MHDELENRVADPRAVDPRIEERIERVRNFVRQKRETDPVEAIDIAIRSVTRVIATSTKSLEVLRARRLLVRLHKDRNRLQLPQLQGETNAPRRL